MSEDLRRRLPGWQDQLGAGVEPSVLLDKLQPLTAFATLRPFIEAYLVVARALVETPADEKVDRKAFVKRCLALGEQWIRQERVRSPEAVSTHMFRPAVQLAEHRGLLSPSADIAERRRQFVDELADVARRIDVVEERTYDAAGRSLTDGRW